MSSLIAHGFVAAAMGRIFCKFSSFPSRRFWIVAVCLAMLPDADVLGFGWGIHYGDLLGHRGLTHSILFAAVIAPLVVTYWFREHPRFGARWWSHSGFFFLAILSHDILDGMTDGGLGIAYFSPFEPTRYFLPWRPLKVSPIGVFFFSEAGLRVILEETVSLILPSIAFILIRRKKEV